MARDRLDLAGVPCPMNSARALMRMETLEPGDVLEIKVDDGEPALNVPASLKAEGHKILKKSRSGGVWTITARKAGK